MRNRESLCGSSKKVVSSATYELSVFRAMMRQLLYRIAAPKTRTKLRAFVI